MTELTHTIFLSTYGNQTSRKT